MKKSQAGFTLLELIVALSLSTFVLIGIISVATSMIAYQMDSARRGLSESDAVAAAVAFNRDLRDATYLQCPGTAHGATCSPANTTTGNVLSGCTNWSTQMAGVNIGGKINSTYSGVAGQDECTGGNSVKGFYYCTPDPTNDPRLIRYFSCNSTCVIPAPGSCGAAAAGATMQVIVPATGPNKIPGFWRMDGLSYYYERADDIAGAGVHFIVGVGTPTVAGGAGGQFKVPVSYKFNMRVGMNKSYNLSGD